MCGIIGATGSDATLALLLEGLSRLEYRGYDSAGIVLATGEGLWRARAAVGTTSVACLADRVASAPRGARAGIGHTRWATHGRPSERNAHPHLDCHGRLALVHNGVFENHREVGERLLAAGHELRSETDTEVLAHLVEQMLADGASLVVALRRALSEARGTFAVAAVHADDPELIVAARRVSPLVLGRAEGVGFVASDVPALLGHASELYVLEDDQVAEVRPGGLVVTDLSGREVPPRRLEVTWDLEAAAKGGYPDFMSKEIHEQPDAVRATLLGRLVSDGMLSLDEVRLSDEELRGVDKVFVVACGSSYHAGLAAKYAIEHWARLPTEIDIASEFRYRDPVVDRETLVVGVSQSGETLDTLQAVREARRLRAKALAVTNVVDSALARESDAVLYTRAGPEIGVASTKTYLATLSALEVLALYLAELRGTVYPSEAASYLEALSRVPASLEAVLARSAAVDEVAGALSGAKDFFFIGRHVGYPTALEGALKLKEIAYLRAEGYPAGELKHGPIALLEPGTVVVAVATRGPLWEKMMANLAEVRARGATVVVVANDGDEATAKAADHALFVPRTHPLFSPILDVVPLQLLAYRLAVTAGRDVDRPRNLAKTVTVE